MRSVVPVFAGEAEVPGPVAVRLPVHRSPYGLFAPLDGSAAASVRPYVIAAEWACQVRERERVRQARRRVALVLADDSGIDLDRHVVGAEGVA
ncbi:hypothetical protein AB0D34_40465 [Streptomyces sp. NPDC048420]|uniref:hypothetical protein n=1 Tax=Streptomyces sp. NPDC048420 TaxID=3155755 RepID=UPI00341CB229